MPFLTVLRALWRMMDSKRRLRFVLLSVALILSGSMEMVGMIVLFAFVQGLTPNPTTGLRRGMVGRLLQSLEGGAITQHTFVIWGGLIVMAFMVFKNLQATAVRFALARFVMKQNQKISERLYSQFLLLPYESIVKKGSAASAGRIGKLFALNNDCFNAAIQIVADTSIVVMVVAYLFYVDPLLTSLATALFVFVGVGVYMYLQRALVRMGRQKEQANQRTEQFLKEGLRGVIEIRLRGTRAFFASAYAAALGRVAVLSRRRQAMERLPRSINEVALAGLIVGVTLYVTLRGETVQGALPTLGVFGFAGMRITGVITRLNVMAQTLKRKLEQFESSQQVLREMIPEVVGLPPTLTTHYLSDERPFPPGVNGRLQREIRLEQVSFTYPGRKKPVVRGLSFSVRRGEYISICGPSGGGKSTILLLLMGLMKPQQGRILCDNWSVFDHIQSWHRNIGYVSQSGFMVGRSVRENVAFGLNPTDVDDGQIWKALELASAASFVREFPKGLDEELSEGGLSLSGGQRQRIMIARALYDDPDILVLDEATAALDNITEREITDAIRRLSGDKTIICVAHRLTSIQNSDRILMFSAGGLVASGTYSELIRTSPEFAALANASDVPS